VILSLTLLLILEFKYRVPKCPVPSTEMSHMFTTEMSRYRVVLIPLISSFEYCGTKL
jgi:hypothetical protein